MKPLELEGPSAARSAAAGASGEVSATNEAGSGRAHGIGQICRQLFGIPDYERYLAHAAEHHGARVLGVLTGEEAPLKVGARVAGAILPASEKSLGYPSIMWSLA